MNRESNSTETWDSPVRREPGPKPESQVPSRFSRRELIRFLVGKVLDVTVTNHTTIVGIDGIDCSGKTMLAEELAGALEEVNRAAKVIHGDHFLNPEPVRYRQGRWSAVGFYEDFFGFRTLSREVLLPLRQGRTVDFEMEWVSMYSQELDPTVRYSIEPSDVAIVEGLYLMRPELVPFFDFLIWLVIPPALVTERALIRDVPRLGDEAFVRKSYELQSIPAYRLYENLCKPALRADIVIDNSSATEPRVVRRNEHSQRQQSS